MTTPAAPAAAESHGHGHETPGYVKAFWWALVVILLGVAIKSFMTDTGTGLGNFGLATAQFSNRNQAWITIALALAGIAAGIFAVKKAVS